MGEMPNENPALTRDQLDFIDWLVSSDKIDPLTGKTCSQNGYAANRNMAASTLTRWKHKPEFRREWEKRYVEEQVKPDRISAVLDSLHDAAVKGDVQAAKEWLRWMDRMSPQKPVDRDAASEVRGLTDQELRAEMQELLPGGDTDDAEAAARQPEGAPQAQHQEPDRG